MHVNFTFKHPWQFVSQQHKHNAGEIHSMAGRFLKAMDLTYCCLEISPALYCCCSLKSSLSFCLLRGLICKCPCPLLMVLIYVNPSTKRVSFPLFVTLTTGLSILYSSRTDRN